MTADTLAPLEPENALPGAARLQTTDVGNNTPLPSGRHSIQSADLLRGATAVEIDHLGQTYLLQTTRAGKLILTK